jgi:transposase-like protein
MDFPTEHWRKIRTNNSLERIMKEIRRRTRVVGSFPAGFPAMMLVGARLRHISTTKWGTRQSRLQNLRNGCIIRKWHNFYNQSKRNVRKIPDATESHIPPFLF